MKNNDKPELEVLPFARATLAFALPMLCMGPLACDEGEDVDDIEMRSGHHPLKQHEPEPEPDPNPGPIDASELVGLTIEDLHDMSFMPVTFQMTELPTVTTYTAPQINTLSTGWPSHALQWKDYLSSTPATSTFDINAAGIAIASNPQLGGWPDPTDALELDLLEGDPSVFSGGDPIGTWMQINIPSPAVGFAYAALVMHFWGSPVYVPTWYHYPTSTQHIIDSVALQRLEFMLPSGTTNLLSACGLQSNATASTALASPPTCVGVALSDDQISSWQWPSTFPGSYVPHSANYSLDPLILAAAMTSLGPFVHGTLVFDPPEEATEEDLQGIEVLAEALADQLLVEGDDGQLVLLREYIAEQEPIEG